MTILLNNCNFLGTHPGTTIAIRDISSYLKEESFNIPTGQDLPEDHYECKGFLVVGDKRSGKTQLTKKELALKAWEVWGKNIDFYDAEDIYALVDAVATSKCAVHYVLLDDQIFYLDSRNPMGNKRITQVYFKIAHELQNRAKLMNGHLGGLVICPILVQSYGAIDLRLRSDMMFTIFKTWDEIGCRYYHLENSEIEDELKKWKIRSNRLTDYEARKNAFVIDINGEGCIIKFDANDPRYNELPFEFKVIRGIDRYKEQRDKLVEWLCMKFPIYDYTDAQLKGKLFYKLDLLSNKREELYINKSTFMEIIYRAREKVDEIYHKRAQEKRKEQMGSLINYLLENFNLDNYTDSELKGELLYKIDEWRENDDLIFIRNNDLGEIIFKTRKKYHDNFIIKEGVKIIDPNKSLTNVERIYNAMNQEKITTTKRLKEITKLKTKQITDTLCKYDDLFERVDLGVYCLKGYNHTQEQIEYLRPPKKNKILIMKERIEVPE